MVFSTCENVGEIFKTLRQRLHRNCRARQIGHVGVTFLIGRLGVKNSFVYYKLLLLLSLLLVLV